MEHTISTKELKAKLDRKDAIRQRTTWSETLSAW